MLNEDFVLAVRVSMNLRVQPRRAARKMPRVALDRLKGRWRHWGSFCGTRVSKTQREEEFVSAAHPGQVGGGRGLLQLDLTRGVEAVPQQHPVERLAKVEWQAQVGLAHHEGFRGA